MKKKFSVEQIASVLKQAEVGVPIAELIRKFGISDVLINYAKLAQVKDTDDVQQIGNG